MAFVAMRTSARTVYVWEGGDHSAGYESWETAANDIQSAVDALGVAGADDEIVIAPGTYKAPSAGGPIVELAGGLLPAGAKLTIRGGLKVTELPPGVAAGETLLDGESENNGIKVELDNVSTERTLVFDGLAIRDCYAENGGGIYFVASSSRMTAVELRNCSVTHNQAQKRGGGFYAAPGSSGLASLLIEDCEFLYNDCVEEVGGGIYFSGGNSGMIVRGCDISYNTATNTQSSARNGAGIYFLSNSSTTATDPFIVENSRFVGNIALRELGNANAGGGGIYRYYGVTNIVRNCLFAENVAHRGPAYFFYSGHERSLFVENCTFVDNTGSYGVVNLRRYSAGGLPIKELYYVNCIFWGGNTSFVTGDTISSTIPGADIRQLQFSRGKRHRRQGSTLR